MNYDKEYLQHCLILVEKKLSWRPSGEWRHYEFNSLSEKILDATGVNLSATTLKRIFGKLKYDNLPSTVTLNALAKYLGYESWMDLKSRQSIPATEKNILQVPVIKKPGLQRKILVAVLTVIVITSALGFVFLSGKTSSISPDPKNLVFKSRPLSNALPNTVVFNLDLKGIHSDNIRIQQDWDSTKIIKLHEGQTEATGMYYIPGYFRAKLIVDGKILKEHDLFIKADQWMATIDFDPVPTYLSKNDIVFKNGLSINESVMAAIKKIDKPSTLTYHLVRPFGGLSGNNFTLETALKNTYHDGPAVCQTSKIFILGTKGAFVIPFSIKGCVASINLKLNDKVLSGTSNDLSKFGTDLSVWNKIKVEVKERVVKIFLNGTLIREEKYEADAGEIVGFRYSFSGAGAVDHILLLNKTGQAVYSEDFKK